MKEESDMEGWGREKGEGGREKGEGERWGERENAFTSSEMRWLLTGLKGDNCRYSI